MKLSGIFLLAAMSLTAGTSFAAEGTFDRTLSVYSAPNLTVNTGSGYIHVYSGSGNQIHIVGRVHVRPGFFGNDSEEILKRILDSPPISQSGDTVKVRPPSSDSGLYRNVSIDYEITAPASTVLDAHTGSGNLEIGGIMGHVQGGSGSGDIHAVNLGTNCQLETGSGGVRASEIHGQASIQTGSGSIELSLASPGDARVRTGSGTIHIEGLNGAVQATAGSGSIYVSGNPASEWRVQSGSGSIHLQIPHGARFNLNASTGSGSIRSEHPVTMTGNISKHHLVGPVNGGGPTLRASTGSGSITVD